MRRRGDITKIRRCGEFHSSLCLCREVLKQNLARTDEMRGVQALIALVIEFQMIELQSRQKWGGQGCSCNLRDGLIWPQQHSVLSLSQSIPHSSSKFSILLFFKLFEYSFKFHNMWMLLCFLAFSQAITASNKNSLQQLPLHPVRPNEPSIALTSPLKSKLVPGTDGGNRSEIPGGSPLRLCDESRDTDLFTINYIEVQPFPLYM